MHRSECARSTLNQISSRIPLFFTDFTWNCTETHRFSKEKQQETQWSTFDRKELVNSCFFSIFSFSGNDFINYYWKTVSIQCKNVEYYLKFFVQLSSIFVVNSLCSDVLRDFSTFELKSMPIRLFNRRVFLKVGFLQTKSGFVPPRSQTINSASALPFLSLSSPVSELISIKFVRSTIHGRSSKSIRLIHFLRSEDCLFIV